MFLLGILHFLSHLQKNLMANNTINSKKTPKWLKYHHKLWFPDPSDLKDSMYFLWNLHIASLRLSLGFRLFFCLGSPANVWVLPEAWRDKAALSPTASSKQNPVRFPALRTAPPARQSPHVLQKSCCFLVIYWPQTIHKANPWFCGFSPHF